MDDKELDRIINSLPDEPAPTELRGKLVHAIQTKNRQYKTRQQNLRYFGLSVWSIALVFLITKSSAGLLGAASSTGLWDFGRLALEDLGFENAFDTITALLLAVPIKELVIFLLNTGLVVLGLAWIYKATFSGFKREIFRTLHHPIF